jgi:hypothetical protein
MVAMKTVRRFRFQEYSNNRKQKRRSTFVEVASFVDGRKAYDGVTSGFVVNAVSPMTRKPQVYLTASCHFQLHSKHRSTFYYETVDSDPSDPRSGIQSLVQEFTYSCWNRSRSAYSHRSRGAPLERILCTPRRLLPSWNNSNKGISQLIFCSFL